MRIFQKTHFWKDKRTFLDADGQLPKLNERGYAEEGNVTLRIGDEEGIRAAFKMNIDEVRALRDVLDRFTKLNDKNMIKLFKEGRERREGHERRDSGYESKESHYDRREEQTETVQVEPAQFSIFDSDEKKEEPKVKYYY